MKTSDHKIYRFTSRITFIILFLLTAIHIQAQQASTEVVMRSGHIYKIEIYNVSKNVYKLKNFNLSNASNLNEVTVSKITKSLVANQINAVFKSDIPSPTPTQIDELNNKVNIAFIELVAQLYNEDAEGQMIANIKLISKIEYYNSKGEKRDAITKNARLVFEKGFIKTVIITIKDEDELITFSNRYPIGITTRGNILKLASIPLKNEHRIEPKKEKTQKKKTMSKESLFLGKAIKFDRHPDVYTNDYSPADTKIYLSSGESVQLYKEKSSKIFNVKAFSDFAGINENNPNGLIQFELSKRINFWTQYKYFTANSGIGIGTHLIPHFELTKIEEHNRNLRYIEFDNTRYTSPLQLKRNAIANAHLDFNLVDIHGPAIEISLNGNFGLSTAALDQSDEVTEIEVININSFMLGANLNLSYKPEKAWLYEIEVRYDWFNPLNETIILQSIVDGELVDPVKGLFRIGFNYQWLTGSGNYLFGRARINFEGDEWKNNFAQYQIGYSFSLKTKGS